MSVPIPLFEYVGFPPAATFQWQGQHDFNIVLLLVDNVTCKVPTRFARESNASRKALLLTVSSHRPVELLRVQYKLPTAEKRKPEFSVRKYSDPKVGQ
ncbi:hypothetical protein BTUL_0013g00210 [Botrytis tulipae]|uniref:Uncharacterized protein n=1 Tax=Botrytis tulipae TaxID=87230 RepID=A0A4Z1F3A2_9HELO|nr:hypothetical protein BTUL_0013g00210 [Botrytis tulipae]